MATIRCCTEMELMLAPGTAISAAIPLGISSTIAAIDSLQTDGSLSRLYLLKLVRLSKVVIPSLQMRWTAASELSFLVVFPFSQFLNETVTIVIYSSLSDRIDG